MESQLHCSFFPAAALALFGGHALASQGDDLEPPAMLINEVLFDAPGAAGSIHSYQFVELVTTSATSTGGVALRRTDGALVCSLPSLALPQGTHVVVYIGPKAATIENLDPNAGAIVLTSGQAFADVLGVSAGGVVLAAGSDELDRVSWGTLAAPGAFVDIGFQGGKPLIEGDSIGRSASSFYSGTSADWTIAGGVNANGATPGRANLVQLPELVDVVLFQDTLLNSALVALSQSHENAGWLQIVDTHPTAAGLSTPAPDQVVGQAQHELDVSIHGAPVKLAGLVATTVDRTTTAGNVAECWSSTGTIASADGQWGLTLQFQQTFSGAHSLQQTVVTAASYEWTHQGVCFVATFTGTWVQTRVDDDSFSAWDLRVGADWSGAPMKAAFASWSSDRLSDGVWETTSSIARTYPSLLAYPGASHANATPIESVFETTVSSYSGRGLLEATTVAYAQFLDSAVVAQLADGAVGALQVAESYDAAGHHFSITAHYPLISGAGTPRDLKLSTTGVTVDGGGKEVTYGAATATTNGVLTNTSTFAIDPPQGPVPLPQPPFRPHGEVERKIIERLAVWITCVESGPKQPPKQPKPTPFNGASFCRQIPILGFVLNIYCLYKALRPLL